MIRQETISQLKELSLGNPPPENSSIFGANITLDEAQISLIGVPFEATTSYGGGTALAPHEIVLASHQLDLFDPDYGDSYLSGITYRNLTQLSDQNRQGKAAAQEIIKQLEQQQPPNAKALQTVNHISEEVNALVYNETKSDLSLGLFPGLLGGDHSCPLGLIKALGEKYDNFGILHIDAHHDLRKAYEGFKYSHASIMFNVLHEVKQVHKLVSVGIRDFSSEEHRFANSDPRIETLYDHDFQRAKMLGTPVANCFLPLINSLPEYVYISFDIDGLDPSLSPNTGTPVPGGLSFSEACFLLKILEESGKKVIGFDLCELVPGEDSEWDMNVGARILYKLCGIVKKTQNLTSILCGDRP